MRTKEKAYAKLNLSLRVGERVNGFHEIDTVVTTVDLYDIVTVETRRDDKINMIPAGLKKYQYDCTPIHDNAYKAAALFAEKYSTGGVNVTVRKRIPLSGGMGGSSTDAAAVLRAMARLFKIEDDMSLLANQLGSDTAYLLHGGFARLTGRGEIIENLSVKRKMCFAVVYPECGCNTTDCFRAFDETGKRVVNKKDVDDLIAFLCGEQTDFKIGLAGCKNDLFVPACELVPAIKKVYDAVKALSPDAVFMTGSGSTVCAVYSEEPLVKWAVDKLKSMGYEAECLYSVCPKH